jgi:hypothetical protein
VVELYFVPELIISSRHRKVDQAVSLRMVELCFVPELIISSRHRKVAVALSTIQH